MKYIHNLYIIHIYRYSPSTYRKYVRYMYIYIYIAPSRSARTRMLAEHLNQVSYFREGRYYTYEYVPPYVLSGRYTAL